MTLLNEPNNYTSTTFLVPRPFQVDAHERLRQGIRDGHRCQMIMSPSEAGKRLGEDTPILIVDGATKMVQGSDSSGFLPVSISQGTHLPLCEDFRRCLCWHPQC